MRPPVCCICDKKLNKKEGGLIYFKLRPSDIEWNNRMAKTGMVGHPPYAEWFCDDHFKKANQLSHLTLEEVIKQF